MSFKKKPLISVFICYTYFIFFLEKAKQISNNITHNDTNDLATRPTISNNAPNDSQGLTFDQYFATRFIHKHYLRLSFTLYKHSLFQRFISCFRFRFYVNLSPLFSCNNWLFC